MPLIDTAHTRAGAFAQNNETALEFLVFQRFKFIENRKQHDWRELSEQDDESEENGPCNQPPVLRTLTYEHVEQFNHDRGHEQTDQQTLELIPYPRTKSLVGKVIAMLEPEAVVLERNSY